MHGDYEMSRIKEHIMVQMRMAKDNQMMAFVKLEGKNNAKKLIRRLYDIQAAKSLSDLSPLLPL